MATWNNWYKKQFKKNQAIFCLIAASVLSFTVDCFYCFISQSDSFIKILSHEKRRRPSDFYHDKPPVKDDLIIAIDTTFILQAHSH